MDGGGRAHDDLERGRSKGEEQGREGEGRGGPPNGQGRNEHRRGQQARGEAAGREKLDEQRAGRGRHQNSLHGTGVSVAAPRHGCEAEIQRVPTSACWRLRPAKGQGCESCFRLVHVAPAEALAIAYLVTTLPSGKASTSLTTSLNSDSGIFHSAAKHSADRVDPRACHRCASQLMASKPRALVPRSCRGQGTACGKCARIGSSNRSAHSRATKWNGDSRCKCCPWGGVKLAIRPARAPAESSRQRASPWRVSWRGV